MRWDHDTYNVLFESVCDGIMIRTMYCLSLCLSLCESVCYGIMIRTMSCLSLCAMGS